MGGKPVLTPYKFALFLLMATALQIMDSMLPKVPIFPWLRFGFSYLIILPFAIQYGWKNALILFLCRNMLSVLYGGQMLSSFLISSFSGLITFAAVVPVLLKLYRVQLLGLSGVAVAMAAFFNSLQLLGVNFLLVRHNAFYFQLTPLLGWSVFSGLAVAALIKLGWSGLAPLFSDRQEDRLSFRIEKTGSSPPKLWIGGALLTVFVLTLLIPFMWFQIFLALFLAVLLRKNLWPLLFYGWPFYFYLAWFYLFQTEGVYIWGEWITREGLFHFSYYFARTINIILLGKSLSLWLRLAPYSWFPKGVYFQGVSLAFPLLPSLFGMCVPAFKEAVRQFTKKKYEKMFEGLISRIEKELGTPA